MPPFLIYQKSSKLFGDQRLDGDFGNSPHKTFASPASASASASNPFRPGSLLSHQHQSFIQPNLSNAKLIPTADKLEASRRVSAAPWMHSPEFCFRPLVLEPVLILTSPYYLGGQYPAFRPYHRPEHHIIRPDGVLGTGPEWMMSGVSKVGVPFTIPTSTRTSPHLIPTGRFDTTYAAAPSFSGKARKVHRSTVAAATGNRFKKRGKDTCKRHPRTCKHCQQSTCQGASTRRSKGFLCETCPKCLTKCSGRCDGSSIVTTDHDEGEPQAA